MNDFNFQWYIFNGLNKEYSDCLYILNDEVSKLGRNLNVLHSSDIERVETTLKYIKKLKEMEEKIMKLNGKEIYNAVLSIGSEEK